MRFVAVLLALATFAGFADAQEPKAKVEQKAFFKTKLPPLPDPATLKAKHHGKNAAEWGALLTFDINFFVIATEGARGCNAIGVEAIPYCLHAANTVETGTCRGIALEGIATHDMGPYREVVIEVCKECLKDPDGNLRRSAAKVLGKLKAREALKDMIDANLHAIRTWGDRNPELAKAINEVQ